MVRIPGLFRFFPKNHITQIQTVHFRCLCRQLCFQRWTVDLRIVGVISHLSYGLYFNNEYFMIGYWKGMARVGGPGHG